ncbi:MAG: carbohydrate ABC transporter permease [Clostridiales bacterium]|nr:carbohydrate ABC transporter permease [Clostridiales bacterium]
MEKTAGVKPRKVTQDIVFNAIVVLILLFLIVIMAYPIYFVLVASFSDPTYVNNGEMLLYPKGFTLLGYEKVFEESRVWIGYGNTLLYTVLGTALGVFFTMMAGFSLSRRELPFRNVIMGYFVFTMYFSGGLIPYYMVIKSLNLTNTRFLMVIISSIAVYNIIITRSFMLSNVAEELRDAARIDGCGDGRFFFQIVMPLSKAIAAVLVLYLAVTYWNSYFNPMIFLTDRSKYPRALYLREILLTVSTNAQASVTSDASAAAMLQKMSQVIKYGIIVVSTLPIICVYPFLQKYFVKGVMIGSVKG